MCNIWKKGISDKEMSVGEAKRLFSRPEFKELEDLNISGGEALLRSDIIELVGAIIKNKPKLKWFFLSTNGTNPETARDLLSSVSKKIQDVFVCVSLEGNRETHNRVRGINCYDSSLKTLRLCKKSISNLTPLISMTLTPLNCNEKSLMHVKKIADEVNGIFTFRRLWNNDTYYRNSEIDLKISPAQEKLAIRYMENYAQNDPFMRIQSEYFKTGKVPLMGDKETGVKCHAGDVFVLVRPDGSIYPCINSTRKIGDLKRGLFVKKITDLGKYEQCPCCTEMCVYPALNWSEYADNT